MKNKLFLIFIVLGIVNCQNNSQNYDQMAKDLCTCMRPLADINLKIKTLLDDGQTEAVASLMTQVEKLSSEGEKCANALGEKYGIVEGENEIAATKALKKHCPDIATMLEQSATLEQ